LLCLEHLLLQGLVGSHGWQQLYCRWWCGQTSMIPLHSLKWLASNLDACNPLLLLLLLLLRRRWLCLLYNRHHPLLWAVT
jgi:hypothetical protein